MISATLAASVASSNSLKIIEMEFKRGSMAVPESTTRTPLIKMMHKQTEPFVDASRKKVVELPKRLEENKTANIAILTYPSACC